MRVKLKLLNQGCRNNPYWWIIAQPSKKKLNGRHLEHLGVWATQRRSTVPRQVAINKHRVRYWLSVGAEPTKGAAALLRKFDFVPSKLAPFGSKHAYEKPLKPYQNRHFRAMGQVTGHDNRIAFHYRQKLQEQMNIVERKRRLSDEAQAMGHAATSVYDEADTDDIESEEGDVFARKAKFEQLHKRFQKHQKEKGLLLRGNDLRSNIWVKKMEKLARDDLGLDIAGYKDYVQNLKEFAHVNSDLSILAAESLNGGHPDSRKILTMNIAREA